MLTKEEIRKLPKKELKEFINKFGGFTKLKVNKVVKYKNSDVSIPEDALYFEGIASDGSLNMNGYKIKPEARQEAMNEYMTDFGGKVYYQHNMDNVIGQTLTAEVLTGQLKVTGYVYDEYSDGKISKGLVSDLSTGHYTLECVYENANNEKETITEGEFQDKLDEIEKKAKDWDTYRESVQMLFEQWIMVVTKLIRVEYSFVTVGSNKQSEATIKNAITNRLGGCNMEEYKNSLKDKFLNNLIKKNDVEGKETTEGEIEEKTVIEGDNEGDKPTETTEDKPTDNETVEGENTEIVVGEVEEEIIEEVKEEAQEENKSKKTEEDGDCEDDEEDDEEDEDEPEEGGCKKKKKLSADLIDENSIKSENVVETLQAKVNKLENSIKEYESKLEVLNDSLKEADDLLDQSNNVIKLQLEKINKLQGFVDKAKSITIKNGLSFEYKEKKVNDMESKLQNAYNQLTASI